MSNPAVPTTTPGTHNEGASTPITDAAEFVVEYDDERLDGPVVSSKVARQLERENQRLIEALDVLLCTAQYVVNRLDTDNEQQQVAGDLAVAIAHTRHTTQSEPK